MSTEDEKPKFVGGKPRSEVVKLDFAIEYKGQTYSEITVSRLSVADLEAHTSRYNEAKAVDAVAAEKLRLPMFPGTPDIVIDYLDPDDSQKVQDAVARQLPLALRAAIASQPNSGEPSPLSSSERPEEASP